MSDSESLSPQSGTDSLARTVNMTKLAHSQESLEANGQVQIPQDQPAAQGRESQDILDTNHLAIVTLEEALRLGRNTLDSHHGPVYSLRDEAARFRQAYEDLQESLQFALKEQHFAAQMYEEQISRLRVELSQMQRVCADLEAEHVRPAQVYPEPDNERATADAFATLLSKRDEAHAHRLEDLTGSTTALVQAYRTLQDERNSLLVQLRHAREVCSHCKSPTPGAGFSFAESEPLGDSPARSPIVSQLIVIPEISSAITQPKAPDITTPDIFHMCTSKSCLGSSTSPREL